MNTMVLLVFCVHLLYTICSTHDSKISFGRDLCQQKCSDHRKCALVKYRNQALFCYQIRNKIKCSLYNCDKVLCKATTRVKCVTLTQQGEDPGHWYDHTPGKHLSGDLKKHFCSKLTKVQMKFDEETVHAECRLENEVLVSEASSRAVNTSSYRLRSVRGAVAEHGFYSSRHSQMFALSLNTERPLNQTYVLELAICRNGVFDRNDRLMENEKCSGFFFRSTDTHNMTVFTKCRGRRRFYFGRADVKMSNPINLGVLFNSRKKVLILIDLDNKIKLGRCEGFSLFGKFVVQLNYTLKSKVRFLDYELKPLCS